MILDMAVQKNRLDGNIYPEAHVGMNDETIRTTDSNSISDSLICIFELENTTGETIITEETPSYVSSV